MSFTALLAAAAIPVGPSAQPVTFEVRGAFGATVDAGALYFESPRAGRAAIHRLDIATGQRSTIWTAASRRTAVGKPEAGGGRVAFETGSTLWSSRVLVIDVASAEITELGRGRVFDRRNCGSDVQLEDVASAGEVLVEAARIRCGRQTGRRVVRAHGRTGTRVLLSRSTDLPFLSDGAPEHRLEGNQFLTFGDNLVRVRDLATRRVRRYRRADVFSSFAEPAVAADGRVLLDEFRFMGRGRLPRQTIRLVPTSGPARVVHRTRGAYGQAFFCGEDPVLYTLSRDRRMRLTRLDPPLELFHGAIPAWDTDGSCDAGHFVLTVGVDGAPNIVQVFELPT